MGVIRKLIGSLDTDHSRHLALLGCRVVLRFLRSSLASELVAKSTAVCTFVNFERDALECEFLSEPVVAEASAVHCDKSYLSLWNALREALAQHHIDPGHLGELVAQKVILDAYDKCVLELLRSRVGGSTGPWRFRYIQNQTSDQTIPSVALVDLLKWFYPVDDQSELYKQVKDDLNSMGQGNAQVFFNHFVQIKEEISLEVMKQALRRGCALVLAEGATGADLCLPAFLPDSDEVSLVVWIQVKNRNSKQMNDSSKQAVWWKHMHPHEIMPSFVESLPVPSLSILFSMSPDHTESILPPERSEKKEHTVSLAFDEDTIQKWRTAYNLKKETRQIKNFWKWVRKGNTPTLKKRAMKWGEQMSALEESHGPLSDEQLHAEAVKKVNLTTAAVSYSSVLMSDMLQPASSLFTVEEIRTIKKILQTGHREFSAFDKEQRMLVVNDHIQSMIQQFHPSVPTGGDK